MGGPHQQPRRSSALAFWLGCAGVAFALLLVGVAAVMWWMLRRQTSVVEATLPPAWLDSVRARYRVPPELAALALPHSEDGDAAALLEAGARGRRGGGDTIAIGRQRAAAHLRNGDSLTAADQLVVRHALADTTLDRAIRAARRRSWGTPRIPPADSIGRFVFQPLGPGLPVLGTMLRIRGAANGLVLRAHAQLDRRDLARARTSIGALLGLAELIWREAPWAFAPATAQGMVRDGARLLEQWAELARDGLTAAQARSLGSAVANPPRGSNLGVLFARADSAALIAADTTMPRGLRVTAVEVAVVGSLLDPPTRLILGPPERTVAAVRALTRDPDPVVAFAAQVGDTTFARYRELSLRRRLRLAFALERSR